MRHSYQRISCLLLFVFISCSLKGQEHKVYMDTSIVKAKSIKIGDITLYVSDFIKNLPNGKWYYYKTKNRNKKNIDNFLEVEGEFLDSTRNETFKYYYLKGTQTKRVKQPYIIVKYKKGILDGEFKVFSSNGTKLYEGYFVNGRRNGFFIEYDRVKLNNTIRQIDYFIDDALKYSSRYNENGELIRQ